MDLNVSPYYDDFDEKKNYLSILFHPSRSVQARELTQIQTALRSQLKDMGNHLLVDGTPVLNAKMKVDFEKNFIQLSTTDAGNNPVVVADWKNRYFRGNTSGATAQCTHVDVASRTAFFDYRGGKFQKGELLTTFNIPNESFPTITATADETGVGVYAYQEEGIIYVQGNFVYVPEQSVMVDNKANDGSYHIGFEFKESIVTSEVDASLLDPANGAPNYNAPGADRLRGEIVPKAYKSTDTIPDDFNALIIAENGQIIKQNQDTQYGAIMDTLASRTYDESGNYTIKDFPLVIENHPTDLNLVQLNLEAGAAYVNGYKNETLVSTTLNANRSRASESVNNEQVNAVYGGFVKVKKKASGEPDITKMIRVQNKPIINLYATGGRLLGTARAVAADLDATGNMRLYLADTSAVAALFPSVVEVKEAGDLTRSARVNSELEDIGAACPIYGLSEKPVKSVVLNETNYDVIRSYHDVVRGGGNIFTIVADDNYTNFTQQSQNGIVALTNKNGISLRANQYTATTTNVNSGRSRIEIQITDAAVNTDRLDVIVRQHKTQGNPKTKTLVQYIDTFNLTGSNKVRAFPHYDVFRILKVTANGVEQNIENFKFNTGQKDFYYDFGSLANLTAGVNYEVTYEYFRHDGSGDYFCVNSYDNVNNRTAEPNIYSLIPNYVSDSGLVFELRNCLDFRRTVADNTSGTDIIRSDSNLNVDYSFYIARKDKIFMDKDGDFQIVEGVPAKFPEEPESLDGAMLLYNVDYPAYTFDAKDVELEYIDNKRYTMRDIGKLEKRINSIEYYTSLSMLERSAEAKNVTDTEGLTKSKNGILVDSFVGHGVGDIDHPEYRCSVDSENGVLRTPFIVESFDLIQNAGSTNVQFHEHIATMAYTKEKWIGQTLCSEFSNVNPYNVFSWIGSMQMTPSTDNWVDTKRLPAVTTNFEGANDAMTRTISQLKREGFLGTRWNSWQNIWTGSKRPTSRTTSVSRGRWRTTNTRTSEREGRRRDLGWFRQPSRVRTTRRTLRQDVSTTTRTNWAQTIGQRRSGTTLQVVPNQQVKSIGDRVVDTSIIPFMRTIEVKFVARGMKPNVTLRASFDKVDVTANCKPNGGNYGQAVRTDAAGTVVGYFKIPAGKFRTGSRLFRLEDDPNQPTTSTEFKFTASGLIETKQESIISVDNPQLVPRTVSQNRTVQRTGQWRSTTRRTNTRTTQNSETRWYDPLAESFLVVESTGVFVESIDLFFKSKDSSLPVSVFIVENENGYPSQRKVPFSEVSLTPNLVNIDPAGRVATNFKFSDPIYLQGSTEYSFVIMSNSNKYEVAIGKIGGKQFRYDNTSKTWKSDGAVITKQPYTGVMFKSQNASTWTADQERDIKFQMHRCKFTTNEGTAKFQCKDLNSIYGANYKFDLTSFMCNVDSLKLAATSMQFKTKLSGQPEINIENKSNQDLNQMVELRTVSGNDAPILIDAKMKSETSYVSPVINLQRNSFIGISNQIKSIEGAGANDPKNAATYVSNVVNLVNPSDDMRVYLDTLEVPNSKVKLSFKTTEFVPRHIVADTEIGNQYTGDYMQVYWRTRNQKTLTHKAAFKASKVDGTKIFISQLSNVNAFIKSGEWISNNIDEVFILRTDNQTINSAIDWVAGNYPINTVVFHNGNFYQSSDGVVTADGAPTPESKLWVLIPHTTVDDALREDSPAEWRDMKAIDDEPNYGEFTERTFVPVESIDSEFSSFSVKIELLSLDPVNVPQARAMRAMALY